ncbi:MAG: tRNA (adenosine(37)-N6)-threonylcarbamoyltransferase complex dimerization subunit type 1 TsaB [Oscillospiraceae bacterium]|nr:tRNA (adenosine(37)-N6)-threonylcarbamoyltransferase complex dimerization subunit type 1 TsaB [Oscillospiraceae bacterium]
MLILGIDTSGHTASAAICSEEAVLAQTSVVTRLTHSQIILPMCSRIMKEADVSFKDIDCIAAAIGPGSYTGLRIGISAVKGICFANGCKCAGISTLEALAYNFRGLKAEVCCVMHARQELVYNANFIIDGLKVTRLCEDRIIPAADLAAELSGKHGVYAVGDYAKELCEKYADNLLPAPPQLCLQQASSLCYAAFDGEMMTADSLEPDYLQITKAEKDLLEKNK